MAPALAQTPPCAPCPAGARAQTLRTCTHIRWDCGALEQAWAHTQKLPPAADGGNGPRAAVNYKEALLTHTHQCASASDASTAAFKAYLQACDFTAESKAFMHAELAHLLHTMQAEDCSAAQMRRCPPQTRALLPRVPVLAQALYELCEQAGARPVFDLFVTSVLEHMVLIQDVIASGGTVPNARAQYCARYVEDWIRAVALLGSRPATCLFKHLPGGQAQ